MHRVAEDICNAEIALGYDSVCQMSDIEADWEGGMGGDVHIAHSHVPDRVRAKGGKIVWVGHGTPEHCFNDTVEAGLHQAINPHNTLMLVQYWIQNADAMVTFWPRHQKIWQQFCDKGRIIDCVPLGVNKEFWKPIESRGKYLGTPSLMTAENCHPIKWPLDLIIAWPWITEQINDARLHCAYLPLDQQRYWYPFIHRNGAYFRMVMTHGAYNHTDLRNAFVSIDYYIGLVRYGDFNRINLEAKASGCKTISYSGNPYSDYWIDEGDQTIFTEQIVKILRNEVEPRETKEVPDIMETAKQMIKIYERIC